MGSRSTPRQGLPGERLKPSMVPFWAIQEQTILRQDTRPRQEELVGTTARREQGPGKRSLPGLPLEAQDPGKRSLPGRPTKARQEPCRDAPRASARPGERQAPGRDKTSTTARSLPRQATTPPSVLQLIPPHASLWGQSRRTWREAVQP